MPSLLGLLVGKEVLESSVHDEVVSRVIRLLLDRPFFQRSQVYLVFVQPILRNLHQASSNWDNDTEQQLIGEIMCLNTRPYRCDW